ncbi:class I SAM-dependent methyltransferase [Streptomyces sp. NPDC005435]|uniref:class I SAM-dependent methyltransferase n=1 Tax=Streptomyces sp. NPDC005435 TaxID=3154464 RepID=UPI003454A1A9
MSGLNRQIPYGDAAAATKTFTHPLHLPWLNGISTHAAILDYGCGYGRVMEELQQCGFDDLTGVEASPEMISRARLLPQDHARNRSRYGRHADHYGAYGVFETADGAVCRPHTREWFATPLPGFRTLDTRTITAGHRRRRSLCSTAL